MQTTRKKSLKRPFQVGVALERIRKAVEAFPRAAMFQLADEGFCSVFEQLVACIISTRTLDEVTVPTARRLFSVARTAEDMSKLTVAEIDILIRSCTFHGVKARDIREIACQTVGRFNGELPCDRQTLLSFRGVGPKCASLVLGVACGQPHISVDTHVFRVVNRWGYAAASTPEKMMDSLCKKVPRQYWVELNRLLVPFGKHICTGRAPRCSTCPVLDMCRQVGVTVHR
jgi:endonuclease-3